MTKDQKPWPDDTGEPGSHPLPNPKQERFCQEVATGKSLPDAYTAAGYRGDPANARRLRHDDAVWTRIDWLTREVGAKVIAQTAQEISALGYSREDAFKEAGEVLKLAKSLGQTGPAGVMVKLRAEIAGITLGAELPGGADADVAKAAKTAADPKVVQDIKAVQAARKLVVVGGTDKAAS